VLFASLDSHAATPTQSHYRKPSLSASALFKAFKSKLQHVKLALMGAALFTANFASVVLSVTNNAYNSGVEVRGPLAMLQGTILLRG